MNDERDIALVAVDWGTSRLRIWAIDGHGRTVRDMHSEQGMSATLNGDFEAILESHLGEMEVPPLAPVLMCGMVGSRQGWAEAGYLPVPVALSTLAERAVLVPAGGREIRIVPGLSRHSERHPDVMRGEETQLLGLSGDDATGDAPLDRIVCMPGTHSKWVHLSGGMVRDFMSFMTGDTFSALSQTSILNRSLGSDPVDPSSANYRDAVRASLDAPASILANLFSIRSASLLNGLSGDAARARLSGYLIGLEIAGARARFSAGSTVDVVGGEVLCGLYREALAVADIDSVVHDGEALVVEGLKRVASAIRNRELV